MIVYLTLAPSCTPWGSATPVNGTGPRDVTRAEHAPGATCVPRVLCGKDIRKKVYVAVASVFFPKYASSIIGFWLRYDKILVPCGRCSPLVPRGSPDEKTPAFWKMTFKNQWFFDTFCKNLKRNHHFLMNMFENSMIWLKIFEPPKLSIDCFGCGRLGGSSGEHFFTRGAIQVVGGEVHPWHWLRNH